MPIKIKQKFFLFLAKFQHFLVLSLLCLVYFLTIGPISMVMRIFQKHPRSRPMNLSSYWIKVTPTPATIEEHLHQS